MFYNFVQYLRDEFPAELIYSNGRIKIAGQTVIPDRNILVNESGGGEQPWTQYAQPTVQIITRDFAVTDARKLAWDIYKKISSKFGQQFPLATVDGIVYNAIQSAQITGIQEPFNLGADDEGRFEFTTNYKIIYNRV